MHVSAITDLLLCMAVLTALPGCGGNGRIPVEGNVTLDGQPLEQGSIEFSPLPDTLGPAAGGEIADGKFAIPSSGGPLAGKFTVRIKSAGLTGRKILDPRSNTMVDEFAQRLPAQYNSESRIQVEIDSVGPNHFEFAISSQ
jgi:hypothetical protein